MAASQMPATRQPSQSRPNNLVLRIDSGDGLANSNYQFFVGGTASGVAPTTYGDLLFPNSVTINELDTFSMSTGGEFLTFVRNGVDLTGNTIGHHIWAGVMKITGFPAGDTPLDFVTDMGVLVA